MTFSARLRTLLVLIVCAILQPGVAAQARSAPDSFADLVERLNPAVVNISTSQKIKGGAPGAVPGLPLMVPPGQEEQFRDFLERFGMPQGGEGAEPADREVQSLGSGFVIDSAGYIVTNNHVIQNAEQITVIFQDDTKLEAELVGRDPKTDIALLKVTSDKALPFVTFGDSDQARVGDWVLAIGNPFGLGGTVTAGIISARARNINAGPFDDFLQTDAAINRGNSGGPMFNMNGEVIGISTAIFSPTGGNIGIGFATPSALAKPVLDQLRQFGRTHRGWLGVKIQQVTDEIAESVGLETTGGALVLEVNKESPAAKAGVEAGDIVLSFNGKPIKEMRHLPRLVAETKIGSDVEIVIWRNNRKMTFAVKLGELDETEEVSAEPTGEQPAAPVKGEKYLGMNLRDLNAKLAAELSLGQNEGVLVLSVDRGGMAAKRGLRRLDVIMGVNQVPVSTLKAFRMAIDHAREAGREFALVRVARGKTESYVTLPTAMPAK
ncbi:MAG: DegQ family serine endoprotease [Rickettsiales bacterium]|nr:DegQ family serine endoprotease [Rickettsiales bacterium]